MLDCGHPAACWDASDEDDEHCSWCEDVRPLREQVSELRKQLHKKAVIVTGGSPTISGDIGYLEMKGGTLNHVPFDSETITRMQP